MNPAGVPIILVGLAIALIPRKRFTLPVLGTVDGESLSVGTQLFIQVLGVFFVTNGFLLIVGY